MSEPADSLFGSTFACECGKTHAIEPRIVLYDDDAMSRLPSVCAEAAGGRRVAVLMDIRTRTVAGRDAADALYHAGWQVYQIVVPDPVAPPDQPGRTRRDHGAPTTPVCDDLTKDDLAQSLPDVDLVLSVGSGVINDLGKWLAFERNLPFVTVATAASMNGYASANVAPTVRGVKTLIRARPPVAVLADPRIIAQAPYEMTAAGLGDVLAKSVSSADWRLNHLLFGDYYCPRSVGLIAEIEPLYLDHPEDLPTRKPQAVGAIYQALLLTGAAMTMAESSAPSSGGEHMVSHALDMMSLVDGAGHDLHGRQVGVGTILTSDLYRRLLRIDRPRFLDPPGEIDRAFWGPLAGAVEAEFTAKRDRYRLAADNLRQPGAWDDLRARIAPMLRPPEVIRDCLARAQAAYRAEDIGCSRDRLLAVLIHAHQMRSRFTVLDLAQLVGLMPAAAEQIVL